MAILVTFEEIRAAGEQDWRLDNTALKSIRFQGESPPGTPLDWSGVDLTHSDPCSVVTVRRDKGPASEMVEPQQPWSWRKMLNRFDDARRHVIMSDAPAMICSMLCMGWQKMAVTPGPVMRVSVSSSKRFNIFRQDHGCCGSAIENAGPLSLLTVSTG